MSDADATGSSVRSLATDHRLLTILSINFVAITANFAVLPALPAIGDALAVPDARLGLVMTAFTLPTAVMVPVVGVLADLYGRRRIVLPALAVFALSGLATPLVDSFASLLALRVVQGAAFAGTVPMTVTLIGDFYRGPTGATAQGLRSSSTGIGSLLAPAVAGVLAGIAWFYPFSLYGLSLVALVLVYVFLPEPLAEVDEGSTPETGPTGVLPQLREYARSLRESVADRSVATLVVGGFLVFFVRYALLTFVPLFAVRELGASAPAAGLVLAVRGGTRIIVSPMAGSVTARVSDRVGMVLALGTMSLAVALVPFAPSVLVLGLLVGLYGIGGAITNPVMNNAISERTAASTRAGVISGMNALRNTGKAVGPAVLGVVLAFGGFQAVFLIGAAIGVGYAGLVAVALE